jgi:flagellar basal-body rod modification protein FlgD
MTNFIWNGKDADGNTVPAGMYYLSLSGVDAQGATATPTAYVASPVASVSKGDKGDAIYTLLDGRTVSSSDVQQWVS